MFSSGEKIKGIAETANIHWGGFDFYNKKTYQRDGKTVYNGADRLFYLPVINMRIRLS